MSKVAFSYDSVNRTRELNKGLNGKVKLGDEKNTGSTAKYLGGKFLAGVTGTAEGIADLAVGSIYSLTGRKERAKSLFANNITGQRMEELDEAYNPGKLASFAGDVSTGLGQTSLALLSSLVLGPVGAAAGMSSAAASTLSLIPIGLGAAGAGVGEASQKTGELGLREYGYGLSIGVTEMLLERYLGAVGSLGTKAISNGVANTAVGKLADSAVGLVARNAVVKGMVSSTLEEGLEEGVATISGTLLERVWKVDPEAKVTLGEVLYSSLVGGFPGGIIGAGMSTLNVARNEVRGNAIREGGKTEAILNTAADVSVRLTKMSAAKKSSSARMYATEIDRLAKQYNALSEDAKSGKKGAQILGALESAMISAEMAATISMQKADILEALRGGDAAQIESYVGYAKVLTGDNSLTAQDLITNKNGSADLLSVSVWARDFVTPSEALTNAVEIDRLVREQAGQEIPEEEFKAIGELKTDEFKVYGNRIALKEADGYTVADIVQDKETGEHTRYEGAQRFKTAEEAERYIRGGGEVSSVAEASQEAPAAAEEAQKEPETPAEAEKTEEPEQEAKAEAAPEKEKAPAAKKEKVAGEEAAARKHVKDFDSLSASRRRAVLAFERQAIESKLDENTRKAIARIVAVRSGLQVVFDSRVPAKLNGFWNGSLSGGKRVIVLRPQDTKAVARVFLHEMVHDMAKVQPKAYAMLGKEALKLATDDFVKQIEDAYTAYYSETYDHAPTKEEITEEIVAYVLQSRIDQTAFANRFANNSAIQRGGRFLKGLISKLKKTDAKGKEIADGERLLAKFEKALRQYAEGAKVLERVGLTEKAVTEAVEAIAREGKYIKYSVRDIVGDSGKNYGIGVYLDSTLLTGLTEEERVDMVKEYIKELGGSVFTAYDKNGNAVDVHIVDSHKKFKNARGRKVYVNQHLTNYLANPIKQEAVALVDELIFTARQGEPEAARHPHDWVDNNGANDWDVWTTYIQDKENTVWEAKLRIANSTNGEKILYEIHPIEKVEGVEEIDTTSTMVEQSGTSDTSTTDPIVAQQKTIVKGVGEKSSKASVDISKYGKGAKDKETIAKYSKDRYYTKEDAEKTLDKIFTEIMPQDEYTYAEMSKKDRTAAENALWRMLNTREEGARGGIGLDLADFLIRKSVVRSVDVDAAMGEFMYRAEVLGRYVRSFDLSSIKGEIESKYGKKEARAVLSRWSANKNSKAVFTPDQVVDELIELGIDLDREAHPADIFFEIADQYGTAVEAIKTQTDTILFDTMDKKSYDALQRNIASEILDAFYDLGQDSELKNTRKAAAKRLAETKEQFENKISAILDKYQSELQEAREAEKSAKAKLKNFARIVKKAKSIKDFAEGKSGFAADVLQEDGVKAIAKVVGKVVSRNNINAANVKAVADLLTMLLETKIGTVTRDEDGTPHWYLGGVEQETAPLDAVISAEKYFSQDIREYIKDLQTIEGDTLRDDQVKNLYWVLSATDKFLHNVGTYKALNGKRIGAKERALRGIEQIEKAAELNPEGKFARAVRLIKWIMSGYLDPQSVYSMFDGFAPDGVMTELYELVRRGEELAKNREERMLEGLREFMHEHKGYENRLNEGGVYLNGKEISRGAAIEIYELSKREQAKLGLEESAITVPKLGEPRKDGTRRVVSGTDTVTIREGTFDDAVAELYSQFDEADRAFIEQIEAFYKESTGIKREADLDIRGYTNVIEGHYYPIHRDRMTIATRITNAKLAGQEINVYNVPFNKNTKKGARNALHVGNPFTEAQYHASLLGVYENLYEPLMAFDMVYNANVGSTTDVRTVRKAVNRTTADFTEKGDFADKYISKQLADVQRGGKAMTDDNFFDTLIAGLRGNFAVYALGLNLGTILKQTSSYASAFSILSAPAMSRGLAHPVNFEEMDTYSRITYARAADHGLTKAESLTDKVSKFQEMTTKGIEWMDRQVLGRLWNACLEQAEIDGYSKTSEEGKTYAGELLDKIIRETQSNNYISGKSSMMRGNELVKALTMFTGEQVKQASRVWQRAATVAAWKKFGDKRSELGITEEQYAEAKKSLAKSITALLASTAMFVAIGQLMKTLFRQKRRDKNGEEITALQDASMEVTSNLLGMVPLMSDIYDTLARGYDIGGNFFGDALAITADSVSEMSALMKKLLSGESVDDADIGAPIRKTLYALGQVTGIPLRNVYNLSHGVVSMFSKTGGYWLDSKFYHQPYMEDFKKAVAKGDEKMARYLADVIVKSGYGNLSGAEIAELLALYAEGYSGAIPSELTNRVSVDGETVTLTKEQHKKYLASSQQAGVVVSKLLSSDSFKALDGEAKESALRAVYSAYKTKAKVDALGKGGNRLTALSQFHDFDELAAYSAIAKTYTSDDEGVRGGKTKSQKVKEFLRSLGFDEGDREYYILLMACGITSKAIRTNVAKTISASSLSKEEKIKTAEELGYEVKNGKIQIS